MKMVKSLLLGSAAGVVAMAGAQAADLPVKAKPVQYVKICSLYGAGFYYIPGTDTCLKVGGWVRQYIGVNSNNNLTNGYLGSGNVATRASNNGWAWKSRGYITADARTQTEWGTLRGYIAVGESTQGSAGCELVQLEPCVHPVGRLYLRRVAVVLRSVPGTGCVVLRRHDSPSNDTGDGGQTVTAYTAQFGGGLSATLSLEAPRNTTVVGPIAAGSAFSTTAGPATAAVGTTYPDVIANLRMDAAWGTAQVMGAIHNVSGQYYRSDHVNRQSVGNDMGWAIAGGVKINVPMAGPGDYFAAQVSYTQGAIGYLDDGAANAVQAVPTTGGFYSTYNGGCRLRLRRR